MVDWDIGGELILFFQFFLLESDTYNKDFKFFFYS